MPKQKKRCRSCWYYRGDNLTGICVELIVYQSYGQFGLVRKASDSCPLYAPKYQNRELTDEDLAEADRQARKIREESK